MTNWFEELFLKRKRFDDSVQENNFEKGIRHSTVEKYPDPVHFIYELLQNAEDQDATKAQFLVLADKLVFRHNGNPFTRPDVENITGIGNSAKTQEANKIGRFGIGFKSVFAITDRPEIYTMVDGKRFSFAIEHLVVPVALSNQYAQSDSYDTQFIFPFMKGQEILLFSKIKERLSTLGLETLLFLQHLTSIAWQTEKDYGIYLHETDDVRHTVSGENCRDGQIQQSQANYLLFTKTIHIDTEERMLDVRIAFKLDEQGKIVAEPGQKLAVYFPTEQETGLQFRVHGPFLLTDNRANIKSDNETNNRILNECAALLGESIQKVKAVGLLTVEFLSLLPIRREVSTLFMPFYTQVVEALRQYPLLPTTNGTFTNAPGGKLARSSSLRELIDDEQFSSLYETSFRWLSSEITDERVPDLYRCLTKDLKVEVISPESFVRKLEKSFLEQQTDAWLVQFYIFLSKQPSLDIIIKGKPILRLDDGRHVSPFQDTSFYAEQDVPNAYLPPKGESTFPLLKRSLLVNDEISIFFKRIGLSEPDTVDEVLTYILPPYEAEKVALDEEIRHRQDIASIQEALKQKEHPARQRLLTALNKIPFLQAINAKTAKRAWKTPQEIYHKTEASHLWFDGNEHAWFLAEASPEVLLEHVPIPIHPRLNTRTRTGDDGYVTIRTSWQRSQRGLHGFDPDATLDGLQHVLDHITYERARVLWTFLIEHRHLLKGLIETSSSKSFVAAQRTEQFSEIGLLCSQKAWLPDEEGEFYVPKELFLTDVSEAFETNTREAQEVAQKLGMKKAEIIELAEKLALPLECLLLIQNDPEALLTWYDEQQHKPSLPSSISNDPAWRQERAIEHAYAAKGKTYRAVMTNKRVSAAYSEARAYLRNNHTNEDGQIICQLCDQPMPFRLPRGEYFFVACQYIELVEKEYDANYLALCPNCAAEFQYACQTNGQEKADRILAMKITAEEKELVVHLHMPVHQRLRFTQRHLIDLQMAAKDWLTTDLEPLH